MIINCSKPVMKEQIILKIREKNHITHRGTKIRVAADSSLEAMQMRRQ